MSSKTCSKCGLYLFHQIDPCKCPRGDNRISENLKEELFEKLAAIEHQRWADWQEYLFSVCFKTTSGEFVIPIFFVERWKRQIETKYIDLSEGEKEGDRNQVKRYWDLINNFFKSEK